MSTPADRIHPYLLRSLDARRLALVASQVEAVLRVEATDEHIEEREYDEQARLRRHRVIDRRIVRGERYERYSRIVSQMQEAHATPDSLTQAIGDQFDRDLRAAASADRVRADLCGSVRDYADLLPSDRWPAVLAMADTVEQAADMKARLASLGFPVRPSPALERFGIVQFACPPESTVVYAVAGLPRIWSLADPGTPVAPPAPKAQSVATQMAEARTLLGLPEEAGDRLGAGVTVAILDTGIDLAHPAFSRLAPGDYRNFTSAGDPDEEGHGTHVASIAGGDDPSGGGRYRGIAPGCHLVAAKVLGGARIGDLEHVLQGMAWAVFEQRADVLSMSIGDSETPANGRSIWTRACEEAFRHGTLVCVAAGNVEFPVPETITVPADAPHALAVGAIDKTGHLAPFSAQGSPQPDSPIYRKPDCVAPGADIVGARASTAAPGEYPLLGGHDHLHTQLSGTSMATPAVAGCLALIKSQARELGWEMTASELRDTFCRACAPLTDPAGEPYRPDHEIGHGLPNVAGAFAIVEQLAPAHAGAAPWAAALAPRVDPHSPIPVMRPVAVPAVAPARNVAANVCYRCGRQYHTKVGTFSPVWVCHACHAPICTVCWQIGYRACAGHLEPAVPHAQTPPPTSQPSTPVTPAPGPGTPGIGAPAPPAKEGQSMQPNAGPSAPGAAAGPSAAVTFFDRFEYNVQQARSFERGGEIFEAGRTHLVQSFSCRFGQVKQFDLTAGVVWKSHLVLAAVSLNADPADTLFDDIAGLDGLEFDDRRFYAVGILSPSPWPEAWHRLAPKRRNAVFYLVEQTPAHGWAVCGGEVNAETGADVFKPLFDPETGPEKVARAAAALNAEPGLKLPGGSVNLETFLDTHQVERPVVEQAVAGSPKFQIVDQKGRAVIQRFA
jgi:subtilisin family serine protease